MGEFTSILDEEELCRISNLSNYLYPYGKPNLKAVKDCSVPYKSQKYPLSRDNVIYCKDVIVFRNNKNDWYKEIKENICCDVILTPAVSLREKESTLMKEDLKYKNIDGSLDFNGKEVLKNIIINAFNVAIINGKDSLVLGDFGIRSYYINEDDVLEVFLDVLREYKNRFKKIIFVLPFNKKNYYKQFYKKFKGE